MPVKPAVALPQLPEPSPVLAELLGQLYDEVGLELVYQPVVDLGTGEVIDGRARMAHAEANGWHVEPIGVKTSGKDQRDLLRLALNLSTRPMTQTMTRELIRWCLQRWSDQTDRNIARTIGKPDANKTVGKIRASMERVGELSQHDRRTSGGKTFKASKQPSKVYTKSRKEFANVQAVVEEIGDEFPSGRVSRRKAHQLLFAHKRTKYAESAPEGTPEGVKITCQDFRQFEGTGFDLVIADPIWGNHWAHNRKDYAEKVYSILRPGGFLCAFTGDHAMPDFLDVYRAAGFTYRWQMAIVWSDGPAMQNSGVVNCGKTPVLIMQKGGKWQPYTIFKDVVHSAGCPESRLHDYQQPLDACLSLVYTFSPGRGRVADIALGSGTSAVATVLAGNGRTFEGCELDAKNCAIARRRVYETVNSRAEGVTG
jgi:hypothetical protein